MDLVPNLRFLDSPTLCWYLINTPIWWLPCSSDMAVDSAPTCRLPPNGNREPELVVAVWSFPRDFFFSATVHIDHSAVNMGEDDASGSIVHRTYLHQVWQLARALHSGTVASITLPSTLIVVCLSSDYRRYWRALRICLCYWIFLSLRMRLICACTTGMQPRIVRWSVNCSDVKESDRGSGTITLNRSQVLEPRVSE